MIAGSQRLVPLDAFRGIAIALMILVNNPGSDTTYVQLQHSAWNGLTLADTVFPSFLWIAGVALVFSLIRRMESGAPHSQLFRQVCKRAVILYSLGLLVYAVPDFDLAHLRVMGVLQRSAICYFSAAVICMTCGRRGQICWTVALLAFYWMAIMLVPVPSYGNGNLSMEGNLAHYVDSIILGSHNYEETRTWDPEGLLSTLPAIATTLLGVMAGHVLRSSRTLSWKTLWLSALGGFLLGAGLICSVWLPINKSIWSDSFALLMAGLDCVCLAGLMWLYEIRAIQQAFRPLVILGMNAITVYLAAEMISMALDRVHVRGRDVHSWIFGTLFTHFSSPRNASLLFASIFVAAMFGLAHQLHKRNLFLRA